MAKQPYGGPDAGDTRMCPNCGLGNDSSARFCDMCGNVIPGPAAAYSRQPGDTIMCPVCESYGEDNANFCSVCGHPLPLSSFLSPVGAYGPEWGEAVSSSGRRPGMQLDTSPEGRRLFLLGLERETSGQTLSDALRDAEVEAADAETAYARAWNFLCDAEEASDGTSQAAARVTELQRIANRLQQAKDRAQWRVSALLAEWRDLDASTRLDRPAGRTGAVLDSDIDDWYGLSARDRSRY